MDFVKWCSIVLEKLVEISQVSPSRGWVEDNELAEAIFGEEVANSPDYRTSTQRKAIRSALHELIRMGIIDEPQKGNFIRVKVTQRSRELARDMSPLWEDMGRAFLTNEQQRVLLTVNKLGVGIANDHAWIEEVNRDQMLAELGWSEKELKEILWPVAEQLEEAGVVLRDARPGWHVNLEATYRGLVWESWRDPEAELN